MPRQSKLAEFARTKGARDKRPRKRRNDLDYGGARNVELRTRSIANLGRGLNSITNAVEQARITAKYLGFNPATKKKPLSLRDGMDLIKRGSNAGNSALSLRRNFLNIGKVQQGLQKAKDTSEQMGGWAKRIGRILL